MSDETAMMPISATREEVSNQPEVIARVLKNLRPQIVELAQTLTDRGVNQVLASGSGDSWFAGQAARLAWERYAGVVFEPMQAFEYAAYGRTGINRHTANFVISSSGRPTTTWDALDRALNTPAYVIGVTDNPSPDNPFVMKPHIALVPRAKKVGWPAQTTTATIALFISLAIEFGRLNGHLSPEKASHLTSQLEAIPAQMTEVLEDSSPWAEKMAESLAGKRFFTFVGGGPSYAVAQIGSALLAEGPQELGLALAVEEFHHALRIGTIMKGEPVILIAPGGASDARYRDSARVVQQWGARLIAIVTPEGEELLGDGSDGILLPGVEETFSPLLTVLPLHALSIALAQQKVDGGYQRPSTVPQ
jgi:glucosamine--fructose-6-phosphate aminotransferase (isomerizing)